MHAPPGKNVKWVELPSGCVVPGSWSGPLALKAKLIWWGAVGVSLFRVWLTWRRHHARSGTAASTFV